ncbi:hypothetical protein PG994_001758 [Apiospora phragmitis]|uniref:Uncharacterized protein n=1 Tax=Apiospora phragmitis TaxID=2905665 RepID=A0ABR1WUB9_9PEZI
MTIAAPYDLYHEHVDLQSPVKYPRLLVSAAMVELEAMMNLERLKEDAKDCWLERPDSEYRYKALIPTAFPEAAEGSEYIEIELVENFLADFIISASPVDNNAQPVPSLQLISIESNKR